MDAWPPEPPLVWPWLVEVLPRGVCVLEEETSFLTRGVERVWMGEAEAERRAREEDLLLLGCSVDSSFLFDLRGRTAEAMRCA